MECALHLVQHVVVCTTEDDTAGADDLGSLDEDELVVRDTLLDDLFGKASELASKVSSPSRLAKLETMVAPVALAIRRRSSLRHRRTAIAPASTNSFRHRSSIPLVVKITLAPVARILRTRSSVISDSRARIASSWSGSSIVMCTPRCIRCFARFMSKHAIFALVTRVFIAAWVSG